MPHRDEMVTTIIRGPSPTRTASNAELTTTKAPSGNQRRNTRTIATRVLKGEPECDFDQIQATKVGSDSDNRSNRSARSKGSSRSHARERYGRDNPTQVRGDREGRTVRRQRSERLRQIAKRIADQPTQNIKQSDQRFKNASHPRLPIRSLEENCSHVKQYRRWVNDEPTRSTEKVDDILRWMDHFEASKVVPIHTITLDVDSLEVTCWWRYFLVEIGILNVRGRVFKDLICSAPRRAWKTGRGKSNVTSTLVDQITNETHLIPCQNIFVLSIIV